MATLKGQNFRIFWGSNVFGGATNCTVNLTNNTDDTAVKDDAGAFSKPQVTTKSWSITVDALNISDISMFLSSVNSGTSFPVFWTETSGNNNQTPEEADFARTGNAIVTDFTFTCNDRENSVKNVTFTGVGGITELSNPPVVSGSVNFTKGQYVRLYLSNDNTNVPLKVIASAKQLSFHVSVSLEDNSTKDTPGDWTFQEPASISYDISSSALVRANDDITSLIGGQALNDLIEIYEAGTPVKWFIANTSGDNQRTPGSKIVSGSALISSLSISAQVKQAVTYQTQLTGYGAYTVGA